MTTSSFKVEVKHFPRCENLFMMKNQLRDQIISQNNQVTFVDNYSHSKQLTQTTIELQISCHDSILTDK